MAAESINLLDLGNDEMSEMFRQKPCCTLHTDQCLDFYCRKCHEPICSNCTIVTHNAMNGHRIFDFRQYYESHSDKFRRQRETYNKTMNDLANCVNIHSSAIRLVEEKKTALLNAVERDLNENIEQLKARANVLKQKIKRKFNSQQETFRSEKESLETRKKKLVSLLNDYDKSVDISDKFATVKMYHQLKADYGDHRSAVSRTNQVPIQNYWVFFEEDWKFQSALRSRGKISRTINTTKVLY
ncbi:tripartite motif-containing protein 2 [Biomphalaria glabrata]|nr:tripartite motif-containing protein 2-like [Biomphalaria glabrata]